MAETELDLGKVLEQIEADPETAASHLPALTTRFTQMRAYAESRVQEALSLQPTPETLQAVRTYRAELNAEIDQAEEIRKAVKKAIMEPYMAFEAELKSNYTDALRNGSSALGTKISDVESTMKSVTFNACKAYWAELCRVHDINICTFERLGINITLAMAQQKSQPPKKLLAMMDARVESMSRDVDAIQKTEYPAEVMVEYQTYLDLGRALDIVQRRHAEMEAAQKEAERRAIQAAREAERTKVVQGYTQEAETLQAPQISRRTDEVEPPRVEPPRVEEPMLRASFTVTGTREQLIAVREFMKERGISYVVQ